MKKFLFLVGARPQIIKFAALQPYLVKERIKYTLVHSGQHYDVNLSDNFFHELDVKQTDYNLEVGSSSHARQTATIMLKLENVVTREKPDFGALFGDTNTTLAGALLFNKMKLPFIHIEAGLRSHKKGMPEEINRIVTDRLANFLFAPSQKAIENLKKEGITHNVYFTGDLHYDLFKLMERHIEDISPPIPKKEKFVFLTLHREENTDTPAFINRLLKTLDSNKIQVVFPCHPRTSKLIKNKNFKHIKVLPPVPYTETLWFIKHSSLVLTDSGGVQKEAYYLKKPTVILRETTEWTEIVELGFARLAGNNIDRIVDLIKHPWNPVSFKEVYGNGMTASKMVHIIKSL